MGQARDEAGNIWETDAQGNAVRLLQPAQAQMPTDPAFPYQGAQAQAQAANAQADAAINAATQGAQITTAQANADKALLELEKLRKELASGSMTEDQRKAAGQRATLDSIIGQINRVQELYSSGLSQENKKNLWGLLDSWGPQAGAFNTAGQGVADQGLNAFRTPGVGAQSDYEARQFALANTPQADDWDAQIEEKLANIRRRVEANRQALGMSPPQWAGLPEQKDDRPNAMTMPRAVEGPGPGAAEAGSDTQSIPVDPRYQAEFTQWVHGRGGKFSPSEYNEMRRSLDQKYGYGNTGSYTGEAQQIIDAFKTGRTVNLTISPINQPLSGVDKFRNDVVSNPIGAAAVGALDMGGFGAVSALAPDQMAALSEQNPLATTLGQVGGSIAGAGMVSSAARNSAGRLFPQLLGGAGKAKFARNLGTDVAYSGAYGGVSEGDPLTGAAMGGIGSVGGQALGGAMGRAIGGVDLDPAVKFLRQRGIPMTIPQQLGGFVKGMEDKAMSVPLVGDMIRARRMEGMGAFNREAFNEAGSPINAAVQEVGQEGIEQLGDQVSDAYSNATAGANVQFDPQFDTDFAGAVARGQRLPSDLRRSLGEILDARVAPITDTGQMTGDQFQQALRALKATRSRPPSRFEGFEQDYRDSVTGVMDSLEGQMMRGGVDSTVTGLTAANAANRNLRTIEDATTRAAGGSETGTPFVFTPSQLQRAGLKSQARFPGARPFAELSDAGQAVLPSRIPNSGTADRAAQMLLPGAILGGGGLGALASGDVQGAGTGAGLSTAAMLALLAGGTKTGQKALQRAIIERPGMAQALGRAIRDRRGLFGSATLPALLTDY